MKMLLSTFTEFHTEFMDVNFAICRCLPVFAVFVVGFIHISFSVFKGTAYAWTGIGSGWWHRSRFLGSFKV